MKLELYLLFLIIQYISLLLYDLYPWSISHCEAVCIWNTYVKYFILSFIIFLFKPGIISLLKNHLRINFYQYFITFLFI